MPPNQGFSAGAEGSTALRTGITLHPQRLRGRYPDFPDRHSEKVPILFWRVGKSFATPTRATIHRNSLGPCGQKLRGKIPVPRAVFWLRSFLTGEVVLIIWEVLKTLGGKKSIKVLFLS